MKNHQKRDLRKKKRRKAKAANKYYFVCAVKRLGNNLNVLFNFPRGRNESEVLAKARSYLSAIEFKYDKVSVGSTFNLRTLESIVRKQLVEEKSINGYVLDGTVVVENTDINSAINFIKREWKNVLTAPEGKKRIIDEETGVVEKAEYQFAVALKKVNNTVQCGYMFPLVTESENIVEICDDFCKKSRFEYDTLIIGNKCNPYDMNERIHNHLFSVEGIEGIFLKNLIELEDVSLEEAIKMSKESFEDIIIRSQYEILRNTVDNTNKNIDATIKKFYLTAGAKVINDNEVQVVYNFVNNERKNDAINISNKLLLEDGFDYDMYMHGGCVNCNELNSTIRMAITQVPSGGRIANTIKYDATEKDVQDVLNDILHEWEEIAVYLTQNSSQNEDYKTLEVFKKKRTDVNQYCVFVLYEEENDIRYRAIFPYSIDEKQASSIGRKFCEDISIEVVDTIVVGPIDILELPNFVQKEYIREVEGLPGHIHLDYLLYDYGDLRHENMTSEEILCDIASDWISSVDML